MSHKTFIRSLFGGVAVIATLSAGAADIDIASMINQTSATKAMIAEMPLKYSMKMRNQVFYQGAEIKSHLPDGRVVFYDPTGFITTNGVQTTMTRTGLYSKKYEMPYVESAANVSVVKVGHDVLLTFAYDSGNTHIHCFKDGKLNRLSESVDPVTGKPRYQDITMPGVHSPPYFFHPKAAYVPHINEKYVADTSRTGDGYIVVTCKCPDDVDSNVVTIDPDRDNMIVSQLDEETSRTSLETFNAPVEIDGVFLPTASETQKYKNDKPSHLLSYSDIEYEPITAEEAEAQIHIDYPADTDTKFSTMSIPDDLKK